MITCLLEVQSAVVDDSVSQGFTCSIHDGEGEAMYFGG